MSELIIAFLTDNAVVLGSGGAALGIVEYIFAPFRGIRAKFKKPEKVEIANPEALVQVNRSGMVPSEPVVTLTLDQLDARLDARETEVRAKLKNVDANSRAVLQAQLDELTRQKADIDRSLEVELGRIADLEARLTREGNTLSGDKLATARAALETGDYSAADALFAEIEARANPEVQSAARAAFARGEIAEAEVRWPDAAAHYARAAGVQPSLENLFKAREFTWRSGDYPAALRFGEQALELARAGDDQLALARILNDHALTLNTTGRYDEAEPLYRQAIQITKATLGTDHPAYATRLNNLAGLLKATGRYDEAEPLFRQAMKITKATLGTDHPAYATSLNNLAGLYASMKRFDEALPLVEQALEILVKALGNEHPDTKNARQGVAMMRAAATK